jgi:hypothetical protein
VVPQAWLPALQEKAHVLPEQLTCAPEGAAAQQLLPQRVLLQVMSQLLAVHTAEPLEAGGVHFMPQAEQFDGSVAKLVQFEPQSVWLPQSLTQVPPWQSCPLAHEFEQEPQYCLEVCRSTAPPQVPHALFTQACVPVLQLPHGREVPF